MRANLADIALRIDHIGSTAVPGLAAKPIIDVQISVASLEPLDGYRPQIEQCGFVWRAGNPELIKRYFRERLVIDAPTSTSDEPGASLSSSPCCSATTGAPTPSGQPRTPT